ncbi:MAG: four helix bundle suffix domain-containing protein [Candidatus Cloacimonetes bacterium]|nr:four helix bundle suffix domain-containing protein [Candidatus Cloacimonadota bacterium]
MIQKTTNNPVPEPLLPKHGGYRKLRSFQLSQLVYDITVRFCERYISKFSRTHDQMVQAARSGVQNIAEGSQASGTSKKTELKLTNVARASLEELKLDYEDYLRQGGFRLWAADEPLRKALVQRRCSTAEEVAVWVKEVRNGYNGHYGLNGHDGQNGQGKQSSRGKMLGESISSLKSITSKENPAYFTNPPKYSEIAANAALVLLGVACSLLDRQIQAQADAFTKEGGFTEKLYKTRQNARNKI